MQIELTVLLGVFMAACAVNQISHLIFEGSLFAGLRRWARQTQYMKGLEIPKNGVLAAYIRGLFDCRLCFAQEVAIAMTWAILGLAYSVDSDMTTAQGWIAAVVFGPFIVAGVDWILNRCREG